MASDFHSKSKSSREKGRSLKAFYDSDLEVRAFHVHHHLLVKTLIKPAQIPEERQQNTLLDRRGVGEFMAVF